MDFLKNLFTKKTVSTSAAGEFNKQDFKNWTFETLSLAGAAVLGVLIDKVGDLNLGDYAALIGPALLAGLSFLKKKLTNNTEPTDTPTETK